MNNHGVSQNTMPRLGLMNKSSALNAQPTPINYTLDNSYNTFYLFVCANLFRGLIIKYKNQQAYQINYVVKC